MKWNEVTSDDHGKWAIVTLRHPHPALGKIGVAKFGVISHRPHRSPIPTLYTVKHGHLTFWADSFEVEFI